MVSHTLKKILDRDVIIIALILYCFAPTSLMPLRFPTNVAPGTNPVWLLTTPFSWFFNRIIYFNVPDAIYTVSTVPGVIDPPLLIIRANSSSGEHASALFVLNLISISLCLTMAVLFKRITGSGLVGTDVWYHAEHSRTVKRGFA